MDEQKIVIVKAKRRTRAVIVRIADVKVIILKGGKKVDRKEDEMQEQR